MLSKAIKTLPPGKTLARPLRRIGRRGMLLSAGTILDDRTLHRLVAIGG
ncbi:MAG: hypothetical protein O3A19_01805 [Planctomycetota bacterium]|nr:hypothetical protein [Planctomycetota bacterium]MDA1025142.1 hypothetical protein [Planctomycetota bacterium]